MGHHGAGFGDSTNAGGHAGANATPLPPESGDSLLGNAEAGASDDAADYAALDGGDVDSGDSA